MIGKWIRCHVPESKKADFESAQKQWSVIASCPGFLGQFGGFNGSTAIILGLWASQDSYDLFMSQVHDGIFQSNNQGTFYDSIQVDFLDPLLPMPGSRSQFETSISEANHIRFADCVVSPERKLNFLEVQRQIWAPGMKAAKGMLGGQIWSFRNHPHRYLVCSMWETQECHQQYRQNIFPTLFSQAQPDNDMSQISGFDFPLIPEWKVLPIH